MRPCTCVHRSQRTTVAAIPQYNPPFYLIFESLSVTGLELTKHWALPASAFLLLYKCPLPQPPLFRMWVQGVKQALMLAC